MLMGDDHMMAADTASPSTSERNIENINVADVGHVTTCKKLTETHIYTNGTNPGEDGDDIICRPGQCKDPSTCCLHNRPLKLRKLIIAEDVQKLTVHVDKEAVKHMTEKNFTSEDLGRCMARLEWSGENVDEKKMTAFKTDVKEKTSQLLKAVLETIEQVPMVERLKKLVTDLFEEFAVKLLFVRRGSLQFVLQHQSIEAAEKVLNSLDEQKKIQKVLLDFLCSLVPADFVWTVTRYTPTEQDKQLTGSDPLPEINMYLLETDVGDVEISTHMLMGQMARNTVKQFEKIHSLMDSLEQRLASGDLTEDAADRNVSTAARRVVQAIGDETQSTGGHIHESVSLPQEDGQELNVISEHEQLKEHQPVAPHRVPSDISTPGHISTSAELYDEKSHRTDAIDNAEKGQIFHDRADAFEEMKQSPSRSQLNYPLLATAAHITAQYPQQMHHMEAHKGASQGGGLGGKDSDNMARHSTSAFDRHLTGASVCSQPYESPVAGLKGKESVQKDVSHHGLPGGRSDVETTDDDGKSRSGHDSDDAKDKSQESGDEHKPAKQPSPPKAKESKTQQAEQLLNWVNVKSKASQSSDPEIQRMMQQVEHSLEEEEDVAPKARALDTILVLDTSDSVANSHLDQLKTVVHTFIDGIEEIVDTMNLEENLAVVQMGGRAWVRQHLTNDYARVRDVIDAMTPDSKEMKTGGRTPIFQAMMVCLGAIEGRGGVVNVAGCHRVRPRIIFFTDGRPTDEATEFGSDVQSNVNEVKFALVQLVSEFASKKHKTTPLPMFWVPVGSSPDRKFLQSLASLSCGKVVEPENVYELCRYYKVQETIGCVYKMVRKHMDVYETDVQMKSVVEALAGNLEEDEKTYIMEEVRKKQKEPESESTEADDFDNIYEDKELVESGSLPPLGTRVVRGKDWKWNNQDTEGPGTVIQHRKKRDNWVHVMWDNGTHNAYRYGDSDYYDVEVTENHPRQLSESELVEIGVVVKRGKEWKNGDEDGNDTGVVIRKRKDEKVKVRWANGHIGKYRFGAEVQAVDPLLATMAAPAGGPAKEEEEGAVGGYDPAEGEKILVWYWKDLDGKWVMYDHEIQEKLKQAYLRRKDGSCIIMREGKNRRVLFKTRQEKTVDKGVMHEVKSEVMSEREYRQKQGLDSGGDGSTPLLSSDRFYLGKQDERLSPDTTDESFISEPRFSRGGRSKKEKSLPGKYSMHEIGREHVHRLNQGSMVPKATTSTRFHQEGDSKYPPGVQTGQRERRDNTDSDDAFRKLRPEVEDTDLTQETPY